MRFYEINKGDIFIDGISTQEITEKIYMISFVWFCKILGFEGTVRENLIYNTQMSQMKK